MEVEMLSRAAMVYGGSMNNKEKAKEYADRVAIINPGEPILDSLYRLACIKYDPTQYKDKFSPEFVDSEQTEKNLPKEENTEEIAKYGVSVAPNPANPKTTIFYSIPEVSNVRLDVYSINGQKVTTLVNGFSPAGKHAVIFDGSYFGSGIYLYKFQTEGFSKTGKILMIK